MKRIAVVFIWLSVAVWAAAQTETTDPSGYSAQAEMPQTMMAPGMVAGPGGLSTNTGTAVMLAPPSAPLLVTPEVHLTTVNPAVGATNATPGNTAGATNATTTIPVVPTIITTVPQFMAAGASLNQTPPPEQTTSPSSLPAEAGAAAAGTNPAGAPVLAGGNSMNFNLGVGSASGLDAGASTDDRSLVAAARRDRQRAAGAKQHVYTNDNINRIPNRPFTAGGMPGAAAGTD